MPTYRLLQAGEKPSPNDKVTVTKDPGLAPATHVPEIELRVRLRNLPLFRHHSLSRLHAHLRTRFGYKFSAENSELSSERFATGHWSSDHHCSLGLTWFADSIVCIRPCATFSIFRVHGLPIKFGTKLMLATGACSTPARSLASLFRNILNPKTQEYTMNTSQCSCGNVKPTLNRTSLIT